MHLLTYLLTTSKEAAVSALAASPDVVKQAEEATNLSYGDPDLTDKDDLRLCAARNRIATQLIDSLLAYLPGELPSVPEEDRVQPSSSTLGAGNEDLPPPLHTPDSWGCASLREGVPWGFDPATGFSPGPNDPTAPDYTSEYGIPPTILDSLTLNPVDFDPNYQPVWAPITTHYPEQSPDEVEMPCAMVYDLDGSRLHIQHRGACACFHNDDLGICIESLPDLIEAIIFGRIHVELTHDQLRARDLAYRTIYSSDAFLDNPDLVDEYIEEAEHLDGASCWAENFTAWPNDLRPLSAEQIAAYEAQVLEDLQWYIKEYIDVRCEALLHLRTTYEKMPSKVEEYIAAIEAEYNGVSAWLYLHDQVTIVHPERGTFTNWLSEDFEAWQDAPSGERAIRHVWEYPND